MTTPSAVAAYRRAFSRAEAVTVTIQRVQGYAPNVTILAAATLTGIVRNIVPNISAGVNTGLGLRGEGSIEQGDRLVILMADDLTAAGFPVPIVKGDQIVLPDSSEILDVTRVDPYKRALAGALELTATGVS